MGINKDYRELIIKWEGFNAMQKKTNKNAVVYDMFSTCGRDHIQFYTLCNSTSAGLHNGFFANVTENRYLHLVFV